MPCGLHMPDIAFISYDRADYPYLGEVEVVVIRLECKRSFVIAEKEKFRFVSHYYHVPLPF